MQWRNQAHDEKCVVEEQQSNAYYDKNHAAKTVAISNLEQETQLLLTNRATCLEVSQGHRTWYHSICYVWFPITVL